MADRICKMVPGMDLVRFSNSGTEAVMAALRLARAHTVATSICWSKAATTACLTPPSGRSTLKIGRPTWASRT